MGRGFNRSLACNTEVRNEWYCTSTPPIPLHDTELGKLCDFTLLLLLLLLFIIRCHFMLGIYNFTPQTNCISIAYTGATVLWLQFLAHLMFLLTFVLHFYVGTFRSMCVCSAQYSSLSSSLILCFLGILLRYFLNDFVMISVAPIITVTTCVFTFHMRSIHIVSSLYFRIFSSSFLTTFVS